MERAISTRHAFMMMTVALISPALTAAPPPIQGMPVPELAEFDQIMGEFMDDNNIEAGLLGIMRNGVIVYQRGFGWRDADNTELLRHDALMRIASCTKPITAAATQRLIAGNFIDPNDNVFDVGQAGGGILNYLPFPGPGPVDARLQNIRVRHLYTHRGGWDRSITPDPTYQEVAIAAAMGSFSPPGRFRTARFIMGQPLDFTPGTQRQYSNVGFLLLGLIIEQVSGQSHLNYVRQNIFGPVEWLPLNELVAGRTFPADRDPREPWYDDDTMVQNVFDPDGDLVRRPDGGWDHESRIGQGGYVVSTTVLLHLAEDFYISDLQSSDPNYGMPTNGVRDDRWHNGSMPGGTMSMLVQRSDGVNYAVMFNKRGNDVNSPDPNNPVGYHLAIRNLIDAELDAGGIDWPAQGVDGQWVDFADAWPGTGSYEQPWGGLSVALDNSPDESTLNIKPSSTGWTGTIDQKIRIRVPQSGTARIGDS